MGIELDFNGVGGSDVCMCVYMNFILRFGFRL